MSERRSIEKWKLEKRMLSAFLAPTNTHKHFLTHTLNQRALSGKQMSVVILCQCRPILLCSAPFTKKTRTKQKPLRTNYQSCLFVCKFFWADTGEWASSATSWPAIALSNWTNWTSWLTHSRSTLMCSLVFYSSTASPRSKMCVQLRTMGPGNWAGHGTSKHFPSLPPFLLPFSFARVAHLNIYVIGLKFQFARHKNCTNVCAEIFEAAAPLATCQPAPATCNGQLATGHWARIKYLNRLPFPCPTAMILEQLSSLHVRLRSALE